LQNSVDADADGVAAANDVVGIPFAGGLFRTWLPARKAFGICRCQSACRRAAVAADIARVARLQLRLETQRPDLVRRIDMEKYAAVAGAVRPAPSHMQLVIAIGLDRARVTIRLALTCDDTIRHRPDGRGGGIGVFGNKRPAGQAFAVEQLDAVCRRDGRFDWLRQNRQCSPESWSGSQVASSLAAPAPAAADRTGQVQ